jgi:hypothetical protein
MPGIPKPAKGGKLQISNNKFQIIFLVNFFVSVIEILFFEFICYLEFDICNLNFPYP